MYSGVEVDVISLGDADCTVVTQWQGFVPHRILIDGGSGSDAEIILDFLRRRNSTDFWAVVCTHLHNDHASGLIRLVRSNAISFTHGLMHDITKHATAGALRRASADNEGVNEVIETTKELASAFARRGVTPIQPFAGMGIAKWPEMTVLGPSLPYYKSLIEEFTKVELAPAPMPAWLGLAALLGNTSHIGLPGLGELARATPPDPSYGRLAALLQAPSPQNSPAPAPPIFGVLGKSSVQKSPVTQPYNNTSTILGVSFGGNRLLFTGDAGSEALSHLSLEWNRPAYMGVPHHGSDGNLSQNDIERFRPQVAYISAKGDSSHPGRAIVSGLVKVGTSVASTHKSGNLWFALGSVPARTDYAAVEWLRGTGSPQPAIDWLSVLSAMK
ncbi:MAG TPA: MBL fold metallo-hydrolase [Verrucomicrobiae bacterium]|jgi:beta-lactamase superfamily II metal-dependent hydrolase|nr:MBL fold metallo-hydrolase [Verrucomicrobiae bacterium]